VGKLDGYEQLDKDRIKRVMIALVAAQVESGKIPCTEEAIKEAMAEALKDAKQLVNACNEFISG